MFKKLSVVPAGRVAPQLWESGVGTPREGLSRSGLQGGAPLGTVPRRQQM